MELAETRVECSAVHETWSLHPLTDTHIDAPDYAREALEERVQQIADDPKALWIGGGDYWSLIVHGDRRFSGSVAPDYRDYIARHPDRCLETGLELFAPIADKCVGLAVGNHEAVVGKHYHRGLGAELAMRLGIPDKYLGDRGWAIIVFALNKSKVPLRVYQYHGWSFGRLQGRKLIQAERDLGAWRADVFCLGHDHQPLAEIFHYEEVYGTKTGYKTRVRPVAYMNGGSWCYGQKPPSAKEDKLKWQVSDMPEQSWAEGKNFRPQMPSNPFCLIHLDFGHGKDAKKHDKGRPAGFDLEVRRRGDVWYPAGATAGV